MTSTTHSDATAFVARFLANPDDRLGRLVFADWLEERGDDSSTAWADYIRTQAELETMQWNDGTLGVLADRSEVAAYRVRAKLAVTISTHETLTALPKLIPPHRCVVRADGLSTDWDAVDAVPESVAVADGLIPLHAEPWSIHLATFHPANIPLLQKLRLILNVNVYLYGTGWPVRAIDVRWQYHATRPFRPLVGGTWIEPEVQPLEAENTLGTLLEEMAVAGVVDVSFRGTARDVLVAYLTTAGWRTRERLTYHQFEAIYTGVRMKSGVGVVPRFPRRLEFWHEIGGRRFHARGHFVTDESFPQLWFSLRPVSIGD